MATRLYQVIPIVNLAPATPTVYPTALNESERPVLPDIVVKHPDLSIVYTTTQITVTNTGAAPVTFDVLLERIHSIPRELGALANLTPQPYEINAAPGAAAGGTSFLPLGGPPGTGTVILVNPLAANAADDADPATPKITIQGAIDTIPAPADAGEQARNWVIMVAPGDYAEDLVLPNFGMRLQMLALGRVSTTSVSYAPGDGGAEFGTTLVTFSSVDGGGFALDQTLFTNFNNEGWTITGNFLVEGPVVPAVNTIILSLQNVRITGDLNVVDGGGGADVLVEVKVMVRNLVVYGTTNITAANSVFLFGEEFTVPKPQRGEPQQRSVRWHHRSHRHGGGRRRRRQRQRHLVHQSPERIRRQRCGDRGVHGLGHLGPPGPARRGVSGQRTSTAGVPFHHRNLGCQPHRQRPHLVHPTGLR